MLDTTNITDDRGELKEGMYVRVPVDMNESPIHGEYRDFRIGPVKKIVKNSEFVKVDLYLKSFEKDRIISAEFPIDYVERSNIAMDVPFIHIPTKQRGRILIACNEHLPKDKYQRYFVLLNGKIEIIMENEILTPSNHKDFYPLKQLLQYEFHNPSWKLYRDDLIECYSELRSLTYGIEDLVGTRINLLAHQAETVSIVLSDPRCRYILADEVGLGKTIEAGVILKALTRQYKKMKTLIIVPSSLKYQWKNELDNKFWLDFKIVDERDESKTGGEFPGFIVSFKALQTQGALYLWTNTINWDLVIVDEAHLIYKEEELYHRVKTLCTYSKRALVLSATPIQRRSNEYLSLLRLIDSEKYDLIRKDKFDYIINGQRDLRKTISYLARGLEPTIYDPEEFKTEIQKIQDNLEDPMISKFISKIDEKNYDRGMSEARKLLRYLGENYRIEQRVVRNRRANLNIEFPERVVDSSFAYDLSRAEEETIESVHNLAYRYINKIGNEQLTREFISFLFNATFSSPGSLIRMIELRKEYIQSGRFDSHNCARFEYQKELKLFDVIKKLPKIGNEISNLDQVLLRSRVWQEEIHSKLTRYVVDRNLQNNEINRFVNILESVIYAISRTESKLVIFTSWHNTLELIKRFLNEVFKQKNIAEFHAYLDEEKDLQSEVDRFQSDDSCRILLCDELGGEGRNFQIADQIIHVDIPFNPTEIEQRIGRLDRLGRKGEVLSVVLYANNSIEEDLFNIWQGSFELFSKSMSGLEIMLESIQDSILDSLINSTRNGLSNIKNEMDDLVQDIRNELEDERYFENIVINHRRRNEFNNIAKSYQDGSKLRKPVLNWANMTGLTHEYYDEKDEVWFFPSNFNFRSMRNAMYEAPPNMIEALERSGRTHDLKIKGTFNRNLAVKREDLVFFSPGEDWTDSIMLNAIEADRGRCCSILTRADIDSVWKGFEYVLSIDIDPRPLYSNGFLPTHLFQGQGYIQIPYYRVIISEFGEVCERNSKPYRIIENIDRRKIRHLGKRGGHDPYIEQFKNANPPDAWQDGVIASYKSLNDFINKEFNFFRDLAEEAENEFEEKVRGIEAAKSWYKSHNAENLAGNINEKRTKKVFVSIVNGIKNPLIRLESVSFWILSP